LTIAPKTLKRFLSEEVVINILVMHQSQHKNEPMTKCAASTKYTVRLPSFASSNLGSRLFSRNSHCSFFSSVNAFAGTEPVFINLNFSNGLHTFLALLVDAVDCNVLLATTGGLNP